MPLHLLLLPLLVPAAEAPAPGFDRDVKPILKKHCLQCHNAERPRGELDLSTLAGLQHGGASGKVAVSGKPEESLLYTLAAHLEAPQMPPNAPRIPSKDLDVLRRWIATGMKEKSDGGSTPSTGPLGGLVAATPLTRATTITALAVSPDGSLLAVPGLKQVLLHDLKSRRLTGALAFPEGEVHALKFSADGKKLYVGGGVGGASGKIVVFDVGNGQLLRELGEELDTILALDVRQDGTLLALGGPGRVVKVLDVATGKVLHTFRKSTDWITSLSFSPDGLLLAAGDRFGGLHVWEASSGKEFATLRGHSAAVTDLDWRKDGDVLVSGSEDGTVRTWDMHKQTELAQFAAHSGGVTALCVTNDNQILSVGRDQKVRSRDLSGQSVLEMGSSGDQILKLAATPQSGLLVTGDWSGEVRVWKRGEKSSVRVELPVQRQTVAAASVQPILPPAVQSVTTALPTTFEAAQAEAVKAEAELEQAKRAYALKAAANAVAQLKLAAAVHPNEPTLQKAIEEAERAYQALLPKP